MSPASLDVLLLRGPAEFGGLGGGLRELRHQVLVNGIPSNSEGLSELRIYIWLILLNAPPIKTDIYLDLVRQGSSPAYSKIRNDTFRTLATDPLFRRRVTENSLTRVLNAVAWRLHDAHEARVNGWLSPPMSVAGDHPGSPHRPSTGTSGAAAAAAAAAAPGNNNNRDLGGFATGSPGRPRASTDAGSQADDGSVFVGYVQGMNVLAAPFLYAARSEAEAFSAFNAFISQHVPGYIRGSMEGVHRGLALVDEVLAICDPKLSSYLYSKGLNAEIYGFASVLTMSACTPPLPEVLHLWDFLLAFGPHLNLLCVVAQVVLLRDQILESVSPNQVLRSFPPLRAKKIISLAVQFVSKIPDDMYQRIVDHAK